MQTKCKNRGGLGTRATRNIAETLQIQTTLHSGHAAVVLMVSALEGFNCIHFTKCAKNVRNLRTLGTVSVAEFNAVCVRCEER